GLISRQQYERAVKKQETIDREKERLSKVHKNVEGKSTHLAQLLCRPDWNYEKILSHFPEEMIDHGTEMNEQIEMELKYEGYIERQKKEVAKLEHLDAV